MHSFLYPLPPAVHDIGLHLTPPAPFSPPLLVIRFDRDLLRLFDFICTLQSALRDALHCTAVLANGQQVTTATQGRESDDRAPLAAQRRRRQPPLQIPDAAAQHSCRSSNSSKDNNNNNNNNKSVTHERFPPPSNHLSA
ncbi:hypothetical protein CSUB01_07302 [Colletotrichum sublineola]|uniref:Uncharacterized protein n=1 Tax=Colletotrichum sublineola TaxID=1173701 RepID=A0A066XSZ5_COLSU|nr:hypothetical protein CSUB01_07302 [Colletotrichum sublineola]